MYGVVDRALELVHVSADSIVLFVSGSTPSGWIRRSAAASRPLVADRGRDPSVLGESVVLARAGDTGPLRVAYRQGNPRNTRDIPSPLRVTGRLDT